MKVIYDDHSVIVDQLKPEQVKDLVSTIDKFIEDQFKLPHKATKSIKNEFIQELIDVACKEYLNQCEESKQIVLKDITPDNAIHKILQAVFITGVARQVANNLISGNFGAPFNSYVTMNSVK